MKKFEEAYHDLEVAISPYKPELNINNQPIYDTPTKIQLFREFEDWNPAAEKVVIPQFVADWIERGKSKGWTIGAIFDGYPAKVLEWCYLDNEHQELMAKAWLHGYEIEKIPLYYVFIPISISRKMVFLGRKGLVILDVNTSVNYRSFTLTEEEIKSVDKRYWPFAELFIDDINKSKFEQIPVGALLDFFSA